MANKKYTRETRKQHVGLQIESGLSILSYCKNNEISLQTFMSWKRKYLNRSLNSKKVELPLTKENFVQVKFPKEARSLFTINLPNQLSLVIDSEFVPSEIKNLVENLMKVEIC